MVQPAAGNLPAPPALVSVLEPWIEALRRECGSSLRSLYLYGSALAPDFDAKRSDVNLLLVVDELSFPRLVALRRLVRQQQKAAPRPQAVPLVLTEAQVRNSLDVFPAEFLDLQARRALLAGTDVLGELVIARHNLRHQCEYELRAKLVGLRQAYLLGDDSADFAPRLLARAWGGLAAVLRQLHFLRDEAPPHDPEALIAAVGRQYGVDAAALGAPLRARRAPGADSKGELAAHLDALSALIEAVDAEPRS